MGQYRYRPNLFEDILQTVGPISLEEVVKVALIDVQSSGMGVGQVGLSLVKKHFNTPCGVLEEDHVPRYRTASYTAQSINMINVSVR